MCSYAHLGTQGGINAALGVRMLYIVGARLF
jgi:hypothetical protein